MKECKCCFDWCDKEDFSYSLDLKDRGFIGHCNDCVVALGGLDNKDGLTWTNRSRYYHTYEKTNDEWVEYNRNRVSEWGKENPGYFTAKNVERELLKMERRLCAEYQEDIYEIYKESRKMREAGKDVHVDHIVPLKGENVSGLHVPWNLRIISAEENLSKGNKFTDFVEVY